MTFNLLNCTETQNSLGKKTGVEKRKIVWKDAINQSINQQSIISMAFLSIPDSFLSISLLFNERTGISFEIKVDEMSFGDTDTDTDNGQTCVYALVQEERRTKRSQWSTLPSSVLTAVDDNLQGMRYSEIHARAKKFHAWLSYCNMISDAN